MRILRVLVLLTCTSAFAAVDPTLFQDLHWRLLGPFRAGRVLAVTGVPGEAEHFYFGSVNGGVWETKDAGRIWLLIFDDQPIGSIGAIAVAPSNPRVIYVGSGEADMRSDIAQGNGMYNSSDGGKTWSRIGLADSQQIGRIVVHPADPNIVYVAALGHPYGPNAERGCARACVRPESGTRRVSHPRRRTHLATHPEPPRQRHRRGGRDVRAGQSERALRVALADAAYAVERLSAIERAGQRFI